jgi:hypothetical protein
MGTLHVAKVTQRVAENRAIRERVSYGRFCRGLSAVYSSEPGLKDSFPKGFWKDQYDRFRKGDRSDEIHDSTIMAFQWVERVFGKGVTRV